MRFDSHALFAERFAANGITMNQLSVSYAMAENTFAVTQTPVGEPPNIDRVNRLTLQHELKAVTSANEAEMEKVVSCGKPINGVSVKVIDETGQLLSECHVGEILVKSNCMLTDYYKRDDLQPFDAEVGIEQAIKGILQMAKFISSGAAKI